MATVRFMELVRLGPHLHLLRFPVGQAYLWRDQDSLTLIDTGVVGSGDSIARAIGECGLAPQDLDRVILTHFHEDHTGSAAEVGGWAGVPVLAHRLDAPVIRGEMVGPPPDFTPDEAVLHRQIVGDGLPPAPPARIDQELDDGDQLPFGGGAEVVATPGHTDGSIAIHLPAEGVLFTGDNAASVNGRVIVGPFNVDRPRARASFARLAALDIATACFGHGEPMLTGASAAFRETAAAGNPGTG